MTAKGSNNGGGRKKIYGEPTVMVGFRVPKSAVTEIKALVKKELSKKLKPEVDR